MEIIASREYKSKSQQNIHYSDVEFIIKKALGNKTMIESVETTKQGDVNSSYIIICKQPAIKLFLKVENNKKIPLIYSGQIEREFEGAKLCKAVGIPVSDIISCDMTCKDIGKKYILTDYINSNLLSQEWPGLNQEQRRSVKEDILRLIDKMQSIQSDYFGDIYDNGRIGKYSSWSEAFKSLIHIALDDCLHLSSLCEKEVSLIKHAVNECSQKLMHHKASFNHMDLHWHNIFITKNNDNVSINSIIDFGSSLFAPSYSDAYRINDGFLYGTEKFYDNQIVSRLLLDKHQEFATSLFNMMDYYVFLSLLNETNETRAHILNSCRDYLNI